MTKIQDKHAIVNWGICTNTGVMEDGKPCCMKSQNKEKQAIRSSKDFVCEECGEPLTKIPTPPPPPPWPIILCIAAVVIGLVVGGCFLFRSCSNSKVRITVLSSDETMGTVKGSGKYEFNKLITIEANANEGYRFVSWDDGNKKCSREILTKEKEDRTYTALFEPAPALPASVTINVVSSDESMGIVRGGGTFGAGDTIKIEAEAKDGYRFMSWNDGNRERTREIVATNDITYTAQFSPEPPQTAPVVTITVESSDETMGTVKGSGTFAQYISITIEALPKDGYVFDKWNDGNIESRREVITGQDKTFIAFFKKKGVGSDSTTHGTIRYSFGKYVGELKNGIPEGDGIMYYNCRVQIAKHDTKNPPHYADAGDYFKGSWGNGDIVVGTLYSNDGNMKEEIFDAGKRFNPYDLHKEQCQ